VESLLSLCRHGSLASIVPERAARQAPELHAVALNAPVMLRHAGILWRRGASRSAAAREFAALLHAAPQS
jgi:LysR family cyn operon transcriptional activator